MEPILVFYIYGAGIVFVLAVMYFIARSGVAAEKREKENQKR